MAIFCMVIFVWVHYIVIFMVKILVIFCVDYIIFFCVYRKTLTFFVWQFFVWCDFL